MLRLRIEQLDQIDFLTRQSFQARLIDALAEHDCLEEHEPLSDDDLNFRVQRYWSEAEQYHILTEKDLFEFICFKFRMTDGFWRASAVKKIEGWLLSPFVPSSVKVKKLLDISREIGGE